MKSKYAILGLISLSFVLLAPLASANTYDYYLEVGFTTTHKGNVWMVGTEDQFSGQDVDASSIECVYWVGASETVLIPKLITLTPGKILIVFDMQELPLEADGTRVTGALTSGETFLATGPGFMWRW